MKFKGMVTEGTAPLQRDQRSRTESSSLSSRQMWSQGCGVAQAVRPWPEDGDGPPRLQPADGGRLGKVSFEQLGQNNSPFPHGGGCQEQGVQAA